MPFLTEIHQAFSGQPLFTAAALPVFMLVLAAAFYYLRLSRRVRERFKSLCGAKPPHKLVLS
jgi:hypothetical protein